LINILTFLLQENENEFRCNEVEIQMISKNLHDQLFKTCRQPAPYQVDLAKKALQTFDLLGKQEPPLPDVKLPLPTLLGESIEDHFRIIGQEQAQPYMLLADKLANAAIPQKPLKWSRRAGWTRYEVVGKKGGTKEIKAIPVNYPDDEVLVFDIENLNPVSPYPVMAVAASDKCWYSWVAPELARLLSGRKSNKTPAGVTFKHLIPLGDINKPRIIIGHNVSYDRARVEEEYLFSSNQNGWIDTMSLHFAISGLSTQQRNMWMRHKKPKDPSTSTKQEDETGSAGVPTWIEQGAMSSLKDVVKLHLNLDISKETRETFIKGTVEDVVEEFDDLIDYCAKDVEVTNMLFASLLPKFLEKCPHPASFAGMLHMGKGYLTTTKAWDTYVKSAENMYLNEAQLIEKELIAIANEAVKMAVKGKWKTDTWLRCLDWTLPSARAKILPNKPKWYRDLWDSKEQAVKLTTSKRIVPYLLKLEWKSFPLRYNTLYGWMFRVPQERQNEVKGDQLIIPTDPDEKGYDEVQVNESKNYVFYRIPHKDGEGENCGNPMSKSYLKAFENGTLTSNYPSAKEILMKNSRCSYWVSARQRVKRQLVVAPKPSDMSDPLLDEYGNPASVIIPQTVVMGTVTRRAVEPTWMTAANAKGNRIGSELKTLIRAPQGYTIVGADVDSEELWICSTMGDAQFRIHGATPLGFRTLQGTKSKRTDLHTATGDIVGIDRDTAKVFNYSRIYGAGLKHAVQLLLQHSPGLERTQAEQTAKKLFEQTKGTKSLRNRKLGSFWFGGSESFMFNALERIAWHEVPRTPVLGCIIPNSLMPKYVKNDVSSLDCV
jgi:DNA polymerase gamma 1